MTRNRLPVCDVDDLPPGERLLVEVGDVHTDESPVDADSDEADVDADSDDADVDSAGVDPAEICLFNVDGDLFALGARCVHRGGPICKGDRSDKVVTCPWHGWEYDVETGEHLGAADARLPSYPVTVEDGTVYLEMESFD